MTASALNMGRGRFRVRNPETGGDMRLELSRGKHFSSLAEGILVIEGDNIDWLHCASELDRLVERSEVYTFIFYRPWAPRTGEKVERFTNRFGTSPSDIAPVQFVIVSDRTAICAHVLGLAAAGNSGVWIVGSCRDGFRLERCLRSSDFFTDDALFIAAECIQYMGAVLTLDEGGRSHLLVSQRDGNNFLLGPVIKLLTEIADYDQLE